MTDAIHRRAMLAGAAGAVASGPAFAQPSVGLVRVALKTTRGMIMADINVGAAPITGRNFLRYLDAKLLDGSNFYRVSHAPNKPEFGLVEGGLKGNPAKILKPIAHESTVKTGLTHKDGTLSMARRGPGTATADFFIVMGDQPGFDADPTAEGDKNGFAAFGQVSDGMDVVRTIFSQPVSPTLGVGAMRGEMLKTPVTILSARRA